MSTQKIFIYYTTEFIYYTTELNKGNQAPTGALKYM
jgi:hypothetical protein